MLLAAAFTGQNEALTDILNREKVLALHNYRIQNLTGASQFKDTDCSLMLRLHYVPGGHGSHVSGHRGQNGMNVRQT